MKQVLGRFDAPLPAAETMDPVLYGALAEDRAQEDRTTLPIVPEGLRARGRVVAREPGVLAGAGVFRRVFECLGKCGEEADELSFDGMRDGEVFAPGDEVLRVEGPGRILLTGERTALNFLQRLCAVATATRACVDAAQGKVAICDTRKTTPGLRALEKYAVVVGGGRSHRWSLADMVLVKENH
ncbi:MAG: nicotinate-nucleotide diphosphorylase (carboxylating), partial [Gemmatimonadota bacterium]|nr:nicotinate-nucleotide diphosphorylase (carboxylating) [Gemmatimonadota bacterium]